MTSSERFAVYSIEHGWLIDACAGGAWSWDVDDAIWFESLVDCDKTLRAAEIKIYDYCFLRVK